MLFQEYYRAALRLSFFDPCFYLESLLSQGLSVAGSEASLFEHFAGEGWRRGLSPSPHFSVPKYLACYQDVKEKQVDPLYHYMVKGRGEHRNAFPVYEEKDDVQFVALCRCRRVGDDGHIPDTASGLQHGGEPVKLHAVQQPPARGKAETVATQLALAQAHGISVFCIPYERFCGPEVFDRMDPGTEFCLIFNNGSRDKGDGGNGGTGRGHHGLLEAQYRLIYDVLGLLSDSRYCRVFGRPLIVVDRPEVVNHARVTFELWREVARRQALGGLYIVGMPHQPGSARECGLDALIEPSANAVPAADPSSHTDGSDETLHNGGGMERSRGGRSAAVPVFPSFLPDRDCDARSGSNKSSHQIPELFRTWLIGAAQRTKQLSERGLSQLVFTDAQNGWAGGSEQFLRSVGAELQGRHSALIRLHQLAQAVMLSKRLPVLFLYDQNPGDEQRLMRGLIESLARFGDMECFLLIASGQPTEPLHCATSFYLWEVLEEGYNREQGMEYLAGLLRARGDLVVVSGSPTAARLIAPFATAGHRILCLLHELPTSRRSVGSAVAEMSRHAHRILVGTEAIRSRISCAGAVALEDVQVVAPGVPESGTGLPSTSLRNGAHTWASYVEQIRDCLLGMGNEGKRIRLSGRTLGRQNVADDLCVIVPSYNHKRFVLEALDSILAQSVRPKEIRIIDDGSSDGSAELLESLSLEEYGVIVQARENRGAHSTINQGIAETERPIIAILNSDDRWHPLRIEQLIDGVRSEDGADVLFSRIRFIKEEAFDDKVRWYESGIGDYNRGTPLWLSLMFWNFFFTTSNLIAKRTKFMEIGGLAPFRYCHDVEYLLRASVAGHKIRFVEETLCEYRFHDWNTISEDVGKLLLEEAWIVANFMRLRFAQMSEGERSIAAQRILEKHLGARVLGILRTLKNASMEYDYRTIYSSSHFAALTGNIHYYDGFRASLGVTELVEEIRRLVGGGSGAVAGTSCAGRGPTTIVRPNSITQAL